MTAKQHGSLSAAAATLKYEYVFLVFLLDQANFTRTQKNRCTHGTTQFSCCIKGEFCTRKDKGCSLNKGYLYPHLCHLDQAEIRT